MLHCDGVDGSTSFPDASDSAHIVTAHGNAQVDTAINKFPTGSLLLDGTGDYLSIPYSSDFVLGSGLFTIDFWVYLLHMDDWGGMFSIGNSDASGGFSLGMRRFGIKKLVVRYPMDSEYMIGTTELTLNTWQHIALVREASTLKLYIDGVLDKERVSGGEPFDCSASGMVLGRLYVDDDTTYINAQMDEFRWSKGIARWTSNFTPPTAPYPETYISSSSSLESSSSSLNA